MIGGVYSDQKCSICKGRFKHHENEGLWCPKHVDQSPSRHKVIFRSITKRFGTYTSAYRFLTGLRYKYDEGSFDERDYRMDQPLGFENQASQWLKTKQDKKSHRDMAHQINYAISYFQGKNIKDIDFPELEDFFRQLPTHLSGKSKFNIKTTLHSFWGWVEKRNRRKSHPIPIPEFPEISYDMKFRKTVNLETQDLILEEIKAIADRRVWVACRILSTYPKIRPGELRSIKEKDIDLDYEIIRIAHPKSPNPQDGKEVKILDEDVQLIQSLPIGFPEQYFLRHDSGKYRGKRYGVNHLNNMWKRACKELGIKGVSLYPGTKHSTVRGLRQYLRPDEIKRGTGIVSNKAFDRYFATEFEDEVKVYEVRARIRRETKGEVIEIGEKVTKK